MHVKYPDHSIIKFSRVNPAETVGELKARLAGHPEDGTPRQDQRLVANGAIMDEARPLGSFKLCGWSRQKEDVAEVRAVHHLKACAKAGGGAPKGRRGNLMVPGVGTDTPWRPHSAPKTNAGDEHFRP